MYKRVKIFTILLAFIIALLLPQTSLAATPEVRVFFDGQEIVYDVPPQIISDRTMVPLSLTIQAITGSPAEWNAATQTVTFRAGGHTNVHKIGETVVYVDGTPVLFDTPSLIIDSRTLVPVRMIAETSGCNVNWDGNQRYVIITSPPNMTPPVVPATLKPAIVSVSPSKTTVSKGESVVLTVKTNSAANYVWAEYDDVVKNAEHTATTSDGTKTWKVSCSPSVSQRLHILANSTHSDLDAAMEIQYIDVSASNAPVIVDLSVSRTSVVYGESVEFDVRTSANVNYVWAEYDGMHKDASLQSTYNNGEKRWSVYVAPSQSQRVRIYANLSSRTTLGADSRSQNISVSAPASESPRIISVNSNQTVPADDPAVSVTVKTNSIVNYVWIEFGTSTIYADYQGTSGDTKTWKTTISPSGTQLIYIYANSSDSMSGAAYETQQITMVSEAKIIDYSFPDGTTIPPGSELKVIVTTNNSTSSVWVVGQGGESWDGIIASSGNTGNTKWEVHCYPEDSGRMIINATSGDPNSNVATVFFDVTIIEVY